MGSNLPPQNSTNPKLLVRYSSKADFRFRCITHDLFEDPYIRDNIDVYGEDLKDGLSSNFNKMHVSNRPKSRNNFKVAVQQPKNDRYGVSYQVEVPSDEIPDLSIGGRSSPVHEPTFNSPHLEFDVFLAGNLIYSKRETGRFPISNDIISKIRA